MKAVQWSKDDKGFTPTGETVAQLKPGFYSLDPGGMFSPWMLVPKELKHDTVIPTGLAKDIVDDITIFLGKKEHYKRFGFLHKRGYMMCGAPGIGKTMTAMLVIKAVIDAGGIAVAIPQPGLVGFLAHVLQAIRDVHPELPILNFMEDVEQHFKQDPRTLLQVLDGELQVDNVVHIATTNFPDRMDSRLMNRPGRFDRVVMVSPPDTNARKLFLLGMLPKDFPGADIEAMVKESDGFFYSHLHSLVAATQIQGVSLEDAIEGLRKMNAIKAPTAKIVNTEAKVKKLYALSAFIEQTADNLSYDPSDNE